MDTSYLLRALREYQGRIPKPHPGYQEALDWIIEHIDQNFYHFEDILDNERETE